MIKKDYFGKLFTASITGDAHIIILPSNIGKNYIEVKLNSNNQCYEFKDDIFLFKNDDHINQEELINSFKEKSSILGGIANALNYVKLKKSTDLPIEINIYIHDTDKLNIKGDNIDIVFSILDIKIPCVSIDCSNLKFENNISSINNLILKSSNLNGIFLFNKYNNNIDIISNNAKIEIIKNNFNGCLNIKSNNSKFQDELSGDSSVGEFKAMFNNSKIDLK